MGNYAKDSSCYVGEVGGYGYALVPGSKNGVVLLDLKTKSLLDDLPVLVKEEDHSSIQLLLKNKLIYEKQNQVTFKRPALKKDNIKSISTWLHIANCCNLNCPYCYIVGKNKELMSLSVANSYLVKLKHTVEKHGLTSVNILLAGGEPTLNIDLIVYLINRSQELFSSKEIRAKFVLLTNGVILNSRLIKLIKSNSISVCLSLDGLEEWHNETRFFKNGHGSFDKIFKNLNLYLENEITPTILTTITDKNILGIPSLSRFLIDKGLPFRYGLYRDSTEEHGSYEDFVEKVLASVNDCYDYYSDAIKNSNATLKHQFSELHLDRRSHLKSCGVGYSSITVNHLGGIFLCQARMDKDPIGNLRDEKTLLEIAWSQNTLPELQEKDVFDYGVCGKCQWSLVCSGGCPITNLGANGSAVSSSPYCELFKKVIPRLIELKALQLIQLKEKGGDKYEQ